MALLHSPLASSCIQRRDGLVLHLMLKYMTHLAMLTTMALLSSNVLTQSEIYHLRKRAKTHKFCCELQSGTIHLKRNHNYYHQVQLQLYVGSDLYSWCDFCIYTTVGVAVERIYPSKEWQSTCLPILEQYYDTHILPEIVDPIYKPCYVW